MGSQLAAVLLDVGGVFALPHAGKLSAAVGTELSQDRVVRAHYAGAAALDGLGPRQWSAYLTAFALEAGITTSQLRAALPALDEAFRDTPATWSFFPPDAVHGLRRLEATGVGLAMVSNSDGTVEELLRANDVCQVGPGRGTRVAAVVDSHVVGAEKPDPAIFGPALEALGLDAAAAVHVGDTVHADVAGARRAGLRPLHLDPFGFCAFDDHEHVGSVGEVVDLLEVPTGQ